MKSGFKLTAIAVLSVLVLSGCQAKQQPQVETQKFEGPTKRVEMTARQFVFEPDTITVKQGTKVKLHIRSVDVDHGFAIPAYGVNVVLKPHEASDIEFIADKTGTFTFACSVFCGSDHGAMKGTLIVE